MADILSLEHEYDDGCRKDERMKTLEFGVEDIEIDVQPNYERLYTTDSVDTIEVEIDASDLLSAVGTDE